MDIFRSIQEGLAFIGPEKIAIIMAIAILSFFGIRRQIRKMKQMLSEKEDFPESLSVSVGDGFYMTLQRRWYEGQWVYVYFGEPPITYRSSESREERSKLEIPECLKGTPEEGALRRFDELTKPGGVMDDVIKAAYSTPEAIERQKSVEEIGRIVREK